MIQQFGSLLLPTGLSTHGPMQAILCLRQVAEKRPLVTSASDSVVDDREVWSVVGP